jgi:hypothetical protein
MEMTDAHSFEYFEAVGFIPRRRALDDILSERLPCAAIRLYHAVRTTEIQAGNSSTALTPYWCENYQSKGN